MRTEQDLRAAFTVLEDHAPLELTELVEVTDEPRPRRRLRDNLRNNLALAAVAATVVAVAAGAPLLVVGHGHHGPQQPQVSQVPPPAKAEKSVTVRYSFTVGHVAGYTITPTSIHLDVQQASISIGAGSTNGPAGALYVFARGMFDPASAKRGHPVTVNGRGGYFATLTSPSLLDDQGNPVAEGT